jgi:hypothetical protein
MSIQKSFSDLKQWTSVALLGVLLLSVLSCGRENIINDPIDVGTYGFTVSKSGTHNFVAGVQYIYEVQELEVTVTNTGTQDTGDISITLTGDSGGAFELSDTTLPSIAPEDADTFLVSTKTGLSDGTYTATVTALGEGDFEEEFMVSFTVGEAVLQLGIDSGGTLTFGEKIRGYTALPDAQEVTVRNTGNQPLTGVAVRPGEHYSASPDSGVSLAAGASAAFAIIPVSGLASADYTEVLTIGATETLTATPEINASFSVRNGIITISDSLTNGELSTNVATAIPGATITLTAVPADGYALKGSALSQHNDGITFTKTNAVKHTFEMPAGADVLELKAEFIAVADNKMATGGTIDMVQIDSGIFKEVHTFVYSSGDQTSYTLSYSRDTGVSAHVIVAAGGGGGGGSAQALSDGSVVVAGYGGGGGGGGGLIYDEAYTIGATATISVKVGGGGDGGATVETIENGTIANQGKDGKNSSFGSLEAVGGGGGGSTSSNGSFRDGNDGGSGGGGGTTNGTYGAAGSYAGAQGKEGGTGTSIDRYKGGGGGGGATGSGGSTSDHTGGAGGAGRSIDIPGAGSIVFCPGGSGGIARQSETPLPDEPTRFGGGGAAGPGGGSTDRSGRAGKEGVVYVWWDYVAP